MERDGYESRPAGGLGKECVLELAGNAKGNSNNSTMAEPDESTTNHGDGEVMGWLVRVSA